MTQQDSQNLSNINSLSRFQPRPKALKKLFQHCGRREIKVHWSTMPYAIPVGAVCVLKTIPYGKLSKGDLLVFETEEEPQFRRFLAYSGAQLITTIDGTGEFYSHRIDYVQRVDEIRVKDGVWRPHRLREWLGRMTDYGTRRPFTRPLG